MPTSGTHFLITPLLRKKLLLVLGVGLLLVGLGVLLPGLGEAHVAEGATTDTHGSGGIFVRLLTNLWINSVFFTGISAVGVLFVAIHYASLASWSSLIKRVPEAFGYWLPFAGVIMLGLFLIGQHDLFHWTHHSLYEPTLSNGDINPAYDAVLDGKKSYLNTPFYVLRMVVFFVLWGLFFLALRKVSVQEDLRKDVALWHKSRRISIIFIAIFMVSSPVAAWDWIMSIDAHWFSTIFGWYVFVSWWVAMLAFITYIVILLKSAGYLKEVNENHFHELGKYVFAFSIFWAYIWFSQFMLIYYANIPEEAVYFTVRLASPYRILFFVIFFVNFLFPFLMLMTRDAKRHVQLLRLVCPAVVLGHWLDFVLMVSPGVLKSAGGSVGFLEIGCLLVFLCIFLFVVLKGLTRIGLVAKNDPMLEKSIHHHA